jgi:hypothetical protein
LSPWPESATLSDPKLPGRRFAPPVPDGISGFDEMHLTGASEVTLGLLILFGLFVIYTRLKNWFDSNLPIIFYIVLIGYMQSTEGAVPFWLIATGLALGLILRFEFMNNWFTRVVKFLELGALGGMLYLSTEMLLH